LSEVESVTFFAAHSRADHPFEFGGGFVLATSADDVFLA
jgi:hypothetical protein